MINKLCAFLLPAVCVALLLVTVRTAAATPDEARNRGLRYLLDTQLPVGGWISEQFGLTSTGHKLAITAVAAHALVATAPDESVCAAATRAIGFLRHYEGELKEPHTNQGFDYTPWAAAYGLLHLDGLIGRWPKSAEPPDLAGLVETFQDYAARTQHPCGGWDYRTTGQTGAKLVDGSVPFLTAVMLDGLRAWDVREEVRARAIVDLIRSTDAKGLLGYSHQGGRDVEKVRAVLGKAIAQYSRASQDPVDSQD